MTDAAHALGISIADMSAARCVSLRACAETAKKLRNALTRAPAGRRLAKLRARAKLRRQSLP
jgi:hypothetical protein